MKQADSVSFARVLARREVLALSFGAMIGFSWVILTDNWILEAGTGGAALANTDVGTAEAAAVALITIYLPGMPAALLWPHEWIIILAWAVAGSLMYSRARSIYGPADPGRILRRT